MGKDIGFKNLPPAVKVLLAFVPAIIVIVCSVYFWINPQRAEKTNIKKPF